MNGSDKTCLFFGAWSPEKIGHYFYPRGNPIARKMEWEISHKIDACLLGSIWFDQTQGEYVRAVVDGWVVLSFWDRTGDSRFGSNSAFLFNYDAPDAELLEHAKQQFPTISRRFTFELKPRAEAIA